jgi:hypothetical protein
MTNPTTPFSWQMPQSTDLVTDLPADFETFGQAVATSMADLLGGTTGQILSKASNTDMDFTWITNDVGDITAVTAGTGITGGGTSGAVTVSFDQANFGGGQGASGKNAIINGGMQVWQRGTTFTVGAANAYTVDRWQAKRTGLAVGCTVSRQSSGITGIQYGARVQRDSGNTSTASLQFWTNLETVNSIPFAGKTVALSVYAKVGANYSPTSSALTIQLYSGTGTDQNANVAGFTGSTIVAGSTITATTSYVRYTITGTVAANATQLAVIISNAPTGTAGADDWYEIAGVQLEAGSIATPFQTATGTIQGELAACQRYLPAISANNGGLSIGQAYTTTKAIVAIPFPVTARVAPTGVTVNAAANFDLRQANATRVACSSVAFLDATPSCGSLDATATGLVVGNATQFFNANLGTILFTGCEL